MIKFAQNGMHHYQNWNEYLNSNDLLSKYTKTGLLLMSPMNKEEVTQQYNKFNEFNIKTTIIDKNIMNYRFPQINADCGDVDNEGIIEHEAKEMDENTYFIHEEMQDILKQMMY